MKKKFLILVVFIVFLLPQILEAKVYISEIMYDVSGTDTGREWIEIHNDTSENVDLSTYFLYETNVAHKITAISSNSILNPNSFAIVADNSEKFLIDYPNFSGNLFDSVFSLNNSGEELILLDSSKNEIDKASYTVDLGANGTGNSLQFSDSIFIVGNPTPGEVNVTEPVDESVEEENENDDDGSSSSSSDSAHSSQNIISDYVPKPKIKTGIGRDRIVSINTPIEFEVYQSIDGVGKYFWNFGDGESGKKKKVEHLYKHEGEYNVVLNAYFEDYKNTSRAKIKVTEPKLEISVKDFSVIIKNIGNTELNLGEFILKVDDKKKEILKDTIISKGQNVFFDVEQIPIKIDFCYPNGVRYYSNREEKAKEICDKLENNGLKCDLSALSDFFDKM